MQTDSEKNSIEGTSCKRRNSNLDQTFKCSYEGCEKVYARESRLIIHQRTHTGYKPFSCPYEGCGKAFNEKGNLTTHKRIHTGEKPFTCPFSNCKAAFKANGHLRDHIRIHTKHRPFVCDLCSKSFTRNSVLKVHRRIHTGERPYACPLSGCDRRFNEKSSLKIHLVAHMKKINSTSEIAPLNSTTSLFNQQLTIPNASSFDQKMKKNVMPFKFDNWKDNSNFSNKQFFNNQKEEKEEREENMVKLGRGSEVISCPKKEEKTKLPYDHENISKSQYNIKSSAGSGFNLEQLLESRIKIGTHNMIPEGNLAHIGKFANYLENCQNMVDGMTNSGEVSESFRNSFNLNLMNTNKLFNENLNKQMTPISQLKVEVEKKMIENVMCLSESEGKKLYEQLLYSIQNVHEDSYNKRFYLELVKGMQNLIQQRNRIMLDNINSLITKFDASIKNYYNPRGAINGGIDFELPVNQSVNINTYNTYSLLSTPVNFNASNSFNISGYPFISKGNVFEASKKWK